MCRRREVRDVVRLAGAEVHVREKEQRDPVVERRRDLRPLDEAKLQASQRGGEPLGDVEVRGEVAGLREDDASTEIMRKFNLRLANEGRLISTIYPAGDGTIVSVKVA